MVVARERRGEYTYTYISFSCNFIFFLPYIFDEKMSDVLPAPWSVSVCPLCLVRTNTGHWAGHCGEPELNKQNTSHLRCYIVEDSRF